MDKLRRGADRRGAEDEGGEAAELRREAQLRGLEKLWTAGLLSEREYERRRLALEGARRRAAAARPEPVPVVPPAPPEPPPEFVPRSLVETPEEPEYGVLPPLPVDPAAEAGAGAGRRVLPSLPTLPRVSRRVAAGLAGVVALAGVGGGLAVALTRPDNSPHTSDTPAPTARPLDPADALLTGLRTAPVPPSRVAMDATQAQRLVRAFWPVRERALSRGDEVALRNLEGGSAIQADLAAIQPCGGACLSRTPRGLRDVAVMVPRQTEFPAAFLAEAATADPASGGPRNELLVFSRPAPSAPWSLVLVSGIEGGFQLSDTPQVAGPFDAWAPGVAGVQPSTLPDALAAYWQHWTEVGSAPAGSHFAAGAFTDRRGAALHESLLEDRANGVADAVSYTAGDGVWSFAVNHDDGGGTVLKGAALTCGTVRHTTVSTPLRSGTVLTQSAGRTPFGPLVAAGRYTRVSVESVDQVCVLGVPGARQVSVVAVDGAQVLASVERAA